jgi:tripartite ATP-independent transporter DctM subunit
VFVSVLTLTGEGAAENRLGLFVDITRGIVEFASDANDECPRLAVVALGGRARRPVEVDTVGVVGVVVFALAAGIPVAAAFLATVGAGVLIAVIYCAINHFALRGNLDISLPPPISLAEQVHRIGASGRRAFLGLLMPVIMLGGIYGGIFTPTEAAAVALVYTLPVGFLAYRGLDSRRTFQAVVDGVTVTGAVIFILFALAIMSRAMVMDQIPAAISDSLLSLSDNKYVVLALINVLLLAIGMLVDDVSGSIVAAVILMPVAQEIGLHPIHFAAIVGTNLGLGNVTPPCAPLLFMAGGVGKLSLDEYVWPALKMLLIGHLPVVLLVTYVPDLALFLPRLVMGIA